MKITFKDYATGSKVETTLTNGELIEYNGLTWQVQNVAKTMCKLIPQGHNELAMWIHYERLFNEL